MATTKTIEIALVRNGTNVGSIVADPRAVEWKFTSTDFTDDEIAPGKEIDAMLFDKMETIFVTKFAADHFMGVLAKLVMEHRGAKPAAQAQAEAVPAPVVVPAAKAKRNGKGKQQERMLQAALAAAPAPVAEPAPVAPVSAPASNAGVGRGKANTRPQGSGVIATLLDVLHTGKYTREQLYNALVARFPDRATETGGMRVTITVQLKALVKKGHKIECDVEPTGKVYYIA